ncbi:hypothetical protein B0O99DRAFT_596846 [Bisporella sp. PMI_857]|nr:hypothetical protein B0O99DRAFT_596846 [Bisporella sp. PMI_857]
MLSTVKRQPKPDGEREPFRAIQAGRRAPVLVVKKARKEVPACARNVWGADGPGNSSSGLRNIRAGSEESKPGVPIACATHLMKIPSNMPEERTSAYLAMVIKTPKKSRSDKELLSVTNKDLAQGASIAWSLRTGQVGKKRKVSQGLRSATCCIRPGVHNRKAVEALASYNLHQRMMGMFGHVGKMGMRDGVDTRVGLEE